MSRKYDQSFKGVYTTYVASAIETAIETKKLAEVISIAIVVESPTISAPVLWGGHELDTLVSLLVRS